MNFSENETALLIHMWHENEPLYHKGHSDYHRRLVRKTLIADMAEKLGTSSNVIIAKMDSLRTQYASNLKKMKAREESGKSTGCEKEWRWLSPLSFLKAHMMCGTRSDEQDLEDVYEDESGFIPDMEPEYCPSEPPKKSRKRTIPVHVHEASMDSSNIQIDHVISTAGISTTSIPNTGISHAGISTTDVPSPTSFSNGGSSTQNYPKEDECEAFGRLVAIELKNMSPDERVFKKRQIMSVVYS